MERKEMRNVQEYLREMDIDKLISGYLYTYPIEIQSISDESLTIKEVKERTRKKLRKYIERLRTLQVEESKNGKEYVLFAHKMFIDGFDENEYSLVCLGELQDSIDNVITYSYMYTRQEEILGFKISDAKFTQNNIYGLLIDVLYEASFFGYEQQYLEEEERKMDEALEQCQEGKADTYTLDELKVMLGMEKEEKDENASKLQKRVFQAVMEYNKYQQQKEVQKLVNNP